jgi:hypothetical protein
MKQELEAIREEIKAKELKLLELSDSILNYKQTMDREEISYIKDISSEIELTTGKKKFSNQDARDAELKEKLLSDAVYQMQRQAKILAERDLETTRIELQDLKYQFRIFEIMSRCSE